MKHLATKNVIASERQIGYLGRRFIVYLALAHRESKDKLRESMARRGGYILHLDGTCESDSPHLFCALDGISELILDSIKIPSEKKEQLVPFFQGIKENYGSPIALVHDMGTGIVSAVEDVFPQTADLICHFHFLRDIGKDLLKEEYTALQKQLRKLKVRSLLRRKAKHLETKICMDTRTIEAIKSSIESGKCKTGSPEHVPLLSAYMLVKWAFEAPYESSGYGFPFDRPHLDFFRRLQEIHRVLDNIINTRLRDQAQDNKPLLQVYRLLKSTVEDNILNKLAANLERDAEVFDRLRQAMRIALPEGKDGLNDDGDDADMKTIKEKVTEFRKWLSSCNKERYAKMTEQIDKYWKKLFADPITIITAEGEVICIHPQRTNNILERFFRAEKRRKRKKGGTASLSKVLKAMLAETPLVQNLQDQEYYKMILNGCTDLAERFSQIDARMVHAEMMEAHNRKERILPPIKKLIKNSDLPEKILTLFANAR
jgi:hypothetical protein